MGICSSHFSDTFIKKFIEENSKEDFCDYCNEEKPAADFDLLTDFVIAAIDSEYGEPYELGAYYDPEPEFYENRFPFNTVYSTLELLEEFIEVDDFDIIDELASSFTHGYLTERDAMWGPTTTEYLVGGWQSFKEILKHKVRFLFFDPKLKPDFEDEYHESLNPASILEEVEKAIVDLGLIVDIPKNEFSVYRGRQHPIPGFVPCAKELGSPPSRIAKANRMSPPGISMFYGALDTLTCKKEIAVPSLHPTAITTGEFTNSESFRIVDFTGLHEMPSLFDVESRHRRPIVGFLLDFISDLRIPVKPDDSVHIEYIPTQVLTEFIRLKLGAKHGVRGIAYNSVKNPGGICVVLFFDSENCVSEDAIGLVDHPAMVLVGESVVTEFLDYSILGI